MAMKNYGPGPGAYMLPPTVGYEHHDPSRWRNPMYSMRGRYGGHAKGFGPGPAYDLTKMTRVGKANPPAYSMSSRHKQPMGVGIPGPGAYSPELVPRMKEPRPPAYSMQRRYGASKYGATPGPNQYVLPSSLRGPAYSMSSRHPVNMKGTGPGPAGYGNINADLYKQKPPAYSMAARNPMPGDKTKTPGPAAYLPQIKECVPHYSFGIKHSTWPMITAEDDMPCVKR